MLRKARKRAKTSQCKIELIHEDATIMKSVDANQFDWVVSTFMCCVMPDELQELVIEQFSRVLKPGGQFRLLEMVYSKNKKIKRRQDFFAPFVEKVYVNIEFLGGTPSGQQLKLLILHLYGDMPSQRPYNRYPMSDHRGDIQCRKLRHPE